MMVKAMARGDDPRDACTSFYLSESDNKCWLGVAPLQWYVDRFKEGGDNKIFVDVGFEWLAQWEAENTPDLG